MLDLQAYQRPHGRLTGCSAMGHLFVQIAGGLWGPSACACLSTPCVCTPWYTEGGCWGLESLEGRHALPCTALLACKGAAHVSCPNLQQAAVPGALVPLTHVCVEVYACLGLPDRRTRPGAFREFLCTWCTWCKILY